MWVGGVTTEKIDLMRLGIRMCLYDYGHNRKRRLATSMLHTHLQIKIKHHDAYVHNKDYNNDSNDRLGRNNKSVQIDHVKTKKWAEDS